MPPHCPTPRWQVTLEPKAVAVAASATPPLEFKGDLLLLGVFEEACDTQGAPQALQAVHVQGEVCVHGVSQRG